MLKIVKRIRSIMGIALIVILVVAALLMAYVMWHPVFGGDPNQATMSRMKQSEHYSGATFHNKPTQEYEMSFDEMVGGKPYSFSIWKMFFPPKGKNPTEPLPSVQFVQEGLTHGKIAWLGHSTVIMNVEDKIVMIDPVFFRASPIPIFGKPFPLVHSPQIEDLPEIDVVIISHDHYDHLDYKAIKKLHHKVSRFYVPLGIGAHLVRWGVDPEKIEEKDWYEMAEYEGIELTLVPSRHFSGRTFSDRDNTLWGGWVVQSESLNVYFSGDGGYSDEFKVIGEKFGPFDIAFLEDGAYSPAWADMHMFPQQSVQAGLDVGAKVLFPVHWGRYDLSYHKWTESVERFIQKADELEQTVATPQIGEIFDAKNFSQARWWESK